jgi:hypothetical protein
VRILLAALAAAASSTPAASPNVGKLILAPHQVGVGYVMLQRQDGSGVKGTVTLDLCGRSGYPSERLRATRLQVNYLKRGGLFGLSNEVVVYRTGGAEEAMREVIQHAVRCPNTPIRTGEPGLPPLRFTITRLTDVKLLRGALAVRVRVMGVVNGKKVDQTSYAAYQRLGDVLSGVYSFGPRTPAQLQFFLQAAEESAANLRRGHAPNSPTV